MITITSEKVWEFIKNLCPNKNTGSILWSNGGEHKTAIDTFRRKMKEKNVDYAQFIERTRSGRKMGYTLNPNVVIQGGGQIGIRQTKQKRNSAL